MSSSTSFTSKKFNRFFDRNDTFKGIPFDSYELSDEAKALIMLTSLYCTGKITRVKLLGQLKALREGTLTRYKSTYHCKITNKWYSFASFTDILEGLNDRNSYLPEMGYNNLIEVIMLYTNKGYNYSINYIVDYIITPFLELWKRSDYESSDFGSGRFAGAYFETSIKDFPILKKFEFGYNECDYSCCCCCSCKSYRYEADEKAREKIINYFHQYKKGDLTKIPKQDGIW